MIGPGAAMLPDPATPADIIVGWTCLGYVEEAAALHRGRCRFCHVDRDTLRTWVESGRIATADDRLAPEPRRKATR